jgi:hypothetical protein
VSAAEELGDDVTADVAGGAGEKDVHIRRYERAARTVGPPVRAARCRLRSLRTRCGRMPSRCRSQSPRSTVSSPTH